MCAAGGASSPVELLVRLGVGAVLCKVVVESLERAVEKQDDGEDAASEVLSDSV